MFGGSTDTPLPPSFVFGFPAQCGGSLQADLQEKHRTEVSLTFKPPARLFEGDGFGEAWMIGDANPVA